MEQKARRTPVQWIGMTLVVIASCSAEALASPSAASGAVTRAEPDRVLHMRTQEKKRRVEVYRSRERRRGFVVVGRAPNGWTSPVYPMWKVERGDVDGDGVDEALVGIWSRKPRHDEPEPHRTVWVLDWRDGTLYERWRGSALARPLADFDVRRREGAADLLVAWERGARGCFETRYEWNGFGFGGLGKRAVPCSRREFKENN